MSEGSRGCALATAVSVALHAAVAAVLLYVAREPIEQALRGPGAVEVGVVYVEARRPPGPEGSSAPAAQPASRPRAPRAAPAPLAAPAGPVAPAAPEVREAAEQIPTAAEGPGEFAVPAASEAPPVEPGPGAGAAGDPSGGGAGPGAGGAASGGAGTGGGSGGGGGEPDVDEALRSRLAASAARCYPRAARRFRADGTTRVRFCVAEDGRARDEQIVESSGQPLLDEAALGCVIARAAPFPATRSCFTVPIRFSVR